MKYTADGVGRYKVYKIRCLEALSNSEGFSKVAEHMGGIIFQDKAQIVYALGIEWLTYLCMGDGEGWGK